MNYLAEPAARATHRAAVATESMRNFPTSSSISLLPMASKAITREDGMEEAIHLVDAEEAVAAGTDLSLW